jgi:hypothetical protein
MLASATKKEILERAGYTYDFRRMVYYNRRTKKVFSVEAVKDNDEHWLQKRIGEENGLAEWRFYFRSEPSEAVKSELISELA